MIPWRLNCLGYPAFLRSDGTPVRIQTRKHLALLIYLAVEPSVRHRRDRLATLLWPHSPIDVARHSLATGLSVIRAHLGRDAFEPERNTVRLIPGRLETDISQLLSKEPSEIFFPVAQFLDEFEIPDSNDFATWIGCERRRFIPLLNRVLSFRFAEARRQNDLRQMTALVDQLDRLAPFSEPAAKARLEAQVLAGDRIGALRDFDRWCVSLEDELGAAPSQDIEEQALRLRRRGPEMREAQPRPSPVIVSQRMVQLFGRSVDLAECYDIWRHVKSGDARLIALSGSPGVGKTALVEQFAVMLGTEGAAAIRVPCYDVETRVPYSVVGDLIAALIGLPGSTATPPVDLATLSTVVKSVRDRWPSLPEAASPTNEAAASCFSDALHSLVSSVAEEQPLLICIDDFHAADPTSISILHQLARHLSGSPVLLVLAEDESYSGSTTVRSGFVHLPITTTLRVAALSQDSVDEMLTMLFGSSIEPGPTVRRAISHAASGIPLLLKLLAEDWIKCRASSIAISLRSMDPTSRPNCESTLLRAVVESRIMHLSPDVMAVAQMGAILGNGMDRLRMYGLFGIQEDQVLRGFTQLISRRIFREVDGSMRFGDEILRSACYSTIAHAVLIVVHGRVADSLLKEGEDTRIADRLEVAWHLIRANRRVEAEPHLLAGGRESIRGGRPHEVELALSSALPSLSGESRRSATLLLAEALQELGRWQDAATLLSTSEGEEWNEDELVRIEVLMLINRQFVGQIHTSQAATILDRLCEIVTSTHDIETRVRAAGLLPSIQSQFRDRAGLDMCTKAIASLRDEAIEPYNQLHLGLASAWFDQEGGDLEKAIASIAHVEQIAAIHGFKSAVAVRILVGKSVLKNAEGDYSDAYESLLAALELAKELDNPIFRAGCAAGLAVSAGRLGRYQDQILWSNAALQVLPQTDHGILSISSLHELASGLIAENREIEALDRCDEIARRTKGKCPSWMVQTACLMRADIYWLTNNRAAALKCAKQALAISAGQPLIADMSGPYARWTAKLGVLGNSARGAWEVLSEGPLSRQTLHRRDRVELLASRAQLEEVLGTMTANTRRQLERELKDLGDPMRVRLTRLVAL